MPAWITSLLRDEVTGADAFRGLQDDHLAAACASRRAIASPTTPAPITTHSTCP